MAQENALVIATHPLTTTQEKTLHTMLNRKNFYASNREEIESEKATNEVEAPVTGIMRTIEIEEGDSAPVGAAIAVITLPGEELSDEQVADLIREDAEIKRQRAEKMTKQAAPKAAG